MIKGPSVLPTQQTPLSIDYFLGMDVTNTDDIRRSPAMMNCILDDESTPEMRTGYDEEFDLGDGPILGMHKWDNGTVIIHHGQDLYTWDKTNAPVSLATGVMEGNSVSRSFMLGGKLCIKDSGEYVLYDGSTIEDAVANAYAPLFLISTPPTGGGTRNEDLNLLSPTWRQSCNTIAGTLVYQLAATDIDSVTLELNGSPLTVTTDYSVDLSTGEITLTSDPGTHENGLMVWITKADAVDSSLILNCSIVAVYGGASDSRVFFSGNPDYKHLDWWSGLDENGNYDPTYWPDTNTDKVGADDSAIMGYAVQYDTMVVAKRNGWYLRSWELTEDSFGRTVLRFPSTILSGYTEGASFTDAIQIINNKPWFLTDVGMKEMRGSSVRDERNLEDISTLVRIPASGRGASIDFGSRYYLAVGEDTVWVSDYQRELKDNASGETKPIWYEWDNMPVNVWFNGGDYLYFGSKNDGKVYRMKTQDDLYPYNDNGEAINAKWDMHFSTLGRDYYTKLVQNVFIQQKKWSRGEIDVAYATEDTYSGVIHTESMILLDFSDIDFSNFSFDTSRLPRAFNVRIDDARGAQTFRIQLTSSGNPDEFFGFSSISITYQYLSEVR